MFDKMLIVVSLNNLSVFDVRKLRKPFLRENINNITSFLYEPNLNKFYLGTSGALKIYTFIP